MVAHAQGQQRQAMDLLLESLAVSQQVGSKWGAAVALTDLGIVTSADGDTGRAAGYLLQGLRLFRDLGDRWGIARGLHTLGRLAIATGDPDRAARLYGASARLREAIGAPPRLSEQAAYERDLADVRARLGATALAAALAVASARSLEATVDDALAADWPAPSIAAGPAAELEVTAPSGPEPGPDRPSTPLTRRELEVAALIAQGLTNRNIAERLVISEWTVDSHVRHILTKLDVHSRAQVAT
jgi:non-specific serine/threonine protein kinase